MNKLRVVISLDDNILLNDEQELKGVTQKISETIAKLSQKYEFVIVHSGPQLGTIPAIGLDTEISMTQGQIGYWLSQAIENALTKAKHRRKVASLVTQVLVDRNDPAFRHPSRPIGQFYTAEQALRLTKLKGWEMRESAGRGYQHLVPSPEPLDIIEKQSIISLLDSGAIVIAAGGGGVPVVRTKVLKNLKGVEAVIDENLTAERLAELIKADLFVSLTNIPNICLNHGCSDQIALGFISPDELKTYVEQGQFVEESILSKIQAALRFATKRRVSIITSADNLELALARRAGTIIQASL